MLAENLAKDYIEKAFSLLEKVEVAKERKKELTLVASSLIGRVQ
jgi:geranylgeranyl pyrophosphate synthase